MSNPEHTSIRLIREAKGQTLEAFAAEIGLASKGQASEIERGELSGNRKNTLCSIRVALAIEAWSGGKISAASLNPDIQLVEQARGVATA